MVCLGSELFAQSEDEIAEGKREDGEAEEAFDEYEIAHDPKKMFHLIHNKEHFFADCYILFERIMDLGIKELYYSDASGAKGGSED